MKGGKPIIHRQKALPGDCQGKQWRQLQFKREIDRYLNGKNNAEVWRGEEWDYFYREMLQNQTYVTNVPRFSEIDLVIFH